MRLDALLDLDHELFLLVNRVQGALWDLGFGYGTWLGQGIGVLLLLWLGPGASKISPVGSAR